MIKASAFLLGWLLILEAAETKMIDTFPLIVADMIRNFPPQHFTYAGREIEKVEGVLKSLREDGNIGEK